MRQDDVDAKNKGQIWYWVLRENTTRPQVLSIMGI